MPVSDGSTGNTKGHQLSVCLSVSVLYPFRLTVCVCVLSRVAEAESNPLAYGENGMAVAISLPIISNTVSVNNDAAERLRPSAHWMVAISQHQLELSARHCGKGSEVLG